MVSKCPSGVFCIENYTLLIVILITIIILYYLYNKFSTTNIINNELNNIDLANKTNLLTNMSSLFNNMKIPTNFITNNNNDILLNPYQPPLRNNNIFINSGES